MTARANMLGGARVLCAAALLLLVSCASQPPVSVAGLNAAEIFQRAQDATDQGRYSRAMQYYTLFLQRFPDDKEHVAWARYEIAFLYHKVGQNQKSLALFNDLLALYASQGDSLPPAPRVLAEKVKAHLEELLKIKS